MYDLGISQNMQISHITFQLPIINKHLDFVSFNSLYLFEKTSG